jgi:hypothetical protein
MNKKGMIGGLMAGLMAIGMVCPASADLNKDGDFQFWNTEVVEGKLNDRWKAGLEVEFRLGDNASEFYYTHEMIFVGFTANEWLDLQANFREVFELNTKSEDEDDWFSEERPMFDATPHFKWNGWDISDRNRFEYRMFDIKDDAWRYRNKLTLKSPWKFTSWNINPYISDEIFIQEDQDLNRNRFYVGVVMDLIEHVTGDVYFLWQSSDADPEWVDIYVAGVKFKVKF